MDRYGLGVVIVLKLATVLLRVVPIEITCVVESRVLLASFTVARSILSSSTVASVV